MGHISLLYLMHAIVHLKWLIDEYPIILRIEVWLSPPIAPVIAVIMMITMGIVLMIWDKMNSGAIFCPIIKIKQFDQVAFSKISGNQKWNGGTPSLINILNINIVLNNSSLTKGVNVREEFNNTDINIKIEPKLWVKK